jgi:hypothetical protein
VDGGERSLLQAWLAFHRDALAVKCAADRLLAAAGSLDAVSPGNRRTRTIKGRTIKGKRKSPLPSTFTL